MASCTEPHCQTLSPDSGYTLGPSPLVGIRKELLWGTIHRLVSVLPLASILVQKQRQGEVQGQCTWEAAQSGGCHVSSVVDLQGVPILLCGKADHLNLQDHKAGLSCFILVKIIYIRAFYNYTHTYIHTLGLSGLCEKWEDRKMRGVILGSNGQRSVRRSSTGRRIWSNILHTYRKLPKNRYKHYLTG